MDARLRAAAGPPAIRPDAVAHAKVWPLLRVALTGLAGDGAMPWRFVAVTGSAARAAVLWNLDVCNAEVLARSGDHPRRADRTALRDAPVQIAAFADADAGAKGAADARSTGDLAVATTAAGVARFRLAAHAAGLAVRWVTALDAAALAHALGVPRRRRFVGYLCVGYPDAPAQPRDDAAGNPLAGCVAEQ